MSVVNIKISLEQYKLWKITISNTSVIFHALVLRLALSSFDISPSVTVCGCFPCCLFPCSMFKGFNKLVSLEIWHYFCRLQFDSTTVVAIFGRFPENPSQNKLGLQPVTVPIVWWSQNKGRKCHRRPVITCRASTWA